MTICKWPDYKTIQWQAFKDGNTFPKTAIWGHCKGRPLVFVVCRIRADGYQLNTKGTSEELFSRNSGHCIDVFISLSKFDQMCHFLMSSTKMTYQAPDSKGAQRGGLKQFSHQNDLTVIAILPSKIIIWYPFALLCAEAFHWLFGFPVGRRFWNRNQTTFGTPPS